MLCKVVLFFTCWSCQRWWELPMVKEVISILHFMVCLQYDHSWIWNYNKKWNSEALLFLANFWWELFKSFRVNIVKLSSPSFCPIDLIYRSKCTQYNCPDGRLIYHIFKIMPSFFLLSEFKINLGIIFKIQ